MKRQLLTFSIFFLSVATAFSQKKAVFIIADGIPADVIEKLNTTNLKKIGQQGGYTRAYVGGEKGTYTQTPTISAVGYNSVLTGTWVNKHNVWDNDIADPNYNYWNIFRLLKASDPTKKIGIFSSWQDNRTKLVGEKLEKAGKIEFDFHFDGLELDSVHYPHDTAREVMHRIDEAVVDNAAQTIKSNAPDLSWVYLEYTDDMGHMHGDSKQFYDAVEMMDKQVGRIWDAIEYRQQNFHEDWLIIITTDHGRDAATGKHHGGQSERERSGWIFTNAKNLNTHFKDKKVAMVDIMPSIANFLNISIPRNQLMEVDGIPFIGKISATEPEVKLEKGKLEVEWEAIEKGGEAKIWLARTNQFKVGKPDDYQLVTTVPLKKEEAKVDVSKLPSGFYKVVIETPTNFLNRWLIEDKSQKSTQ